MRRVKATSMSCTAFSLDRLVHRNELLFGTVAHFLLHRVLLFVLIFRFLVGYMMVYWGGFALPRFRASQGVSLLFIKALLSAFTRWLWCLIVVAVLLFLQCAWSSCHSCTCLLLWWRLTCSRIHYFLLLLIDKISSLFSSLGSCFSRVRLFASR